MQTGKSECRVRADYLMADSTGCMPDALIREMRTEHICGRLDVGSDQSWNHILLDVLVMNLCKVYHPLVSCSNWAIIAHEPAESCLELALLGNKWLDADELQNMVTWFIITSLAATCRRRRAKRPC